MLGLYGVYEAVRNNNVENGSLTAFAAMSCIALNVSGYELGWIALRLSFEVGFDFLSIGPNVLGFVLLWWLRSARNQFPAAAKPEPLVEAAPLGPDTPPN